MTCKSIFSVLFFTLFVSAAYGQFGSHVHYYHPRPYSSYNATGKRWLKREYIALSVGMMDMGLDTRFTVSRIPGVGNPVTGPSVDTAISLKS
jgi:hypothetical protein